MGLPLLVEVLEDFLGFWWFCWRGLLSREEDMRASEASLGCGSGELRCRSSSCFRSRVPKLFWSMSAAAFSPSTGVTVLELAVVECGSSSQSVSSDLVISDLVAFDPLTGSQLSSANGIEAVKKWWASLLLQVLLLAMLTTEVDGSPPPPPSTSEGGALLAGSDSQYSS